ncbi:tetratricopeptide repeat protein [Kitasatospora sp. NPDC059327]|uniref:tetratricopeptide repeat protein n=1 Tax=Kitasatospora sp. NPDC059327 TaxID=3346803 RepID=UPI00368F9A08
MNVDDLAWQAHTLLGVPPNLARTLITHGHLEVVIQAAREREDWHCAEAAAEALSADGRFERALEVLAPFTATGWNHSRWVTADVMTRQGRGDEALTLMRPDTEQRTDEHYCARYAELAANVGRADDAVTVLTPHLDKAWLLDKLVEATKGGDRDEQVLQLLYRALESATDWPGPARWEVLLHIAAVLERTGRASEAVALLREETAVGDHHPLNFPEYYAALLARQGLTEELAALAADNYHLVGAYTAALTRAGREPETEALLRERVTVHNHDHDRVRLMTLLGAQGRIDEAVEVGLPACEDHDHGGVVHQLIGLLVDDGRPGRALEVLDNLTGWWVEGHPEDVQHMRLWLLGQAGRHTEAIALATALPQDEPGQWDESIAALLQGDGRIEEAVTLLRSSPHRSAANLLADLLARTGRPAEAIAAVPTTADQRAAYEQRQREWKEADPWGIAAALARMEQNEQGPEKTQ